MKYGMELLGRIFFIVGGRIVEGRYDSCYRFGARWIEDLKGNRYPAHILKVFRRAEEAEEEIKRQRTL